MPLYSLVLRDLDIFGSAGGNMIKIMNWKWLDDFLLSYNKVDVL